MWRMPTARCPLRLSSPSREIQGGRAQAGEPGVLRDPEAWGEALTEDGSIQERKKDAVLPDWGSRDLKTGTLRSAIRQLDINWEEFQEA